MIINPRGRAPNPDNRFVCSFEGSGMDFNYTFLDNDSIIETGHATGPRVIQVLFEEFKRGRLSMGITRLPRRS